MFDAAVFSGAQDLHSAPATPLSAKTATSAPPAGFDAVVQCDSVLLQSVLSTHLAQAGASTPVARLPFRAEIFPAAIQNSVAAHSLKVDGASGAEIEVELRLTTPRLTIPSGQGTPQVSLAFSIATDATSAYFDGPTLRLSWNVELNILRRLRCSNAVHVVGTPGPAGVRNVRMEDRTPLARGTAIIEMPSRIGAHPDRLQLWLEMDASHTTVGVTTDAPPLEALLASATGQRMVRSALDALTSQPTLRISPLFAIRGAAMQAAPRALGHGAMRVAHSVRTLSDGNQGLTFAIDLGAAR